MQSLCSKTDELRVILEDRKSQILVTVETWLDASHEDGEVEINDYRIFRLDRSKDPNRGSVAVYTRKCLEATRINMKPHSGECRCENLWLKIDMGKKRTLILGAVYRGHQNKVFTEHLQMDIESLITMKHPILLAGDFNYDLTKINKETTEYCKTLNSFLLEQLVCAPTRITDTTATIIDHFWTSDEQLIRGLQYTTGPK